MNQEKFKKIVQEQLKSSEEILMQKRAEYSPTDDALRHFKRDPEASWTEQWWGMARKHWYCVKDIWEGKLPNTAKMRVEKIGDMINYLILLKALLIDIEEVGNSKAGGIVSPVSHLMSLPIQYTDELAIHPVPFIREEKETVDAEKTLQ